MLSRGLPRRHPRHRTLPGGDKRGSTAGQRRLTPLSANEIRQLLAALVVTPLTCVEQVIHWSRWRRQRQHEARICHHRQPANDHLDDQTAVAVLGVTDGWSVRSQMRMLARIKLAGSSGHSCGSRWRGRAIA